MRYIPLRVYSVFSRGKGAVSPSGLTSLMKRGGGVITVTDPFSMAAWESFYRAAIKNGLKFLPAIEIALRRSGSFLVFPKNADGYFSLVSSYNKKKFTLMRDVEVVFLPGSGCLNIRATVDNIRERVREGKVYFGLEWDTDRRYVEFAERENLPLIWANPLRWTGSPESYKVVSSVFCHLPIGEVANDPKTRLYGPVNFSAITKRWGKFGKIAMKNTFVLSESIKFDFGKDFGLSLAKFRLAGKTGSGRSRLVSAVRNELEIIKAGLKERDRAEKELRKIDELGFEPWFLIGAEIARYCRERKIYFNIRGSGGSSYILYLLGLSRVNPMKHNLLFERFINSLRDELPDIDIDIDSSRREEVLRWVFRKFTGKVAFVSTHKFFRARSALYEVAKSYGFDPEEAHGMSKEIDIFASPSELKGRGSGRIREINERASLLNGVYRELSLHLGGVIFSGGKIKGSFPIEVSPHGFDQIAWDKDTIERLKIFKLDLLGVRGFDVISPYVYNDKVKFDDKDVWDNIRAAKTKGCFQLESPLARENLEKTKPSDLNELAISIAIIRPGPARSGMKKNYIKRCDPVHPVLRELFPYTRGTVIFEEQISILLNRVSGWSLEFSERVRRELKKKRGEGFKEAFFLACNEMGWNGDDINMFWNIACDFSLYAFNNAHSISYAYSAYVSVWMRTKHPVLFFTRLLNSGGGYYPLPVYIEEAKNCGLKILPPDINLSNVGFTEEEGTIRTGFIFVKGIGRKLSELILEKRGTGFGSLEDFINKTRTGERALSALMAVSAFGSVGYNGFTPEERIKNWTDYLGFIPDDV